jgi:hypothetical protein
MFGTMRGVSLHFGSIRAPLRRVFGRSARKTRRPAGIRTVEQLETRTLLTGTWTTLSNLAPSNTGTMMLLSDGSVMVQGGGTTNT